MTVRIQALGHSTGSYTDGNGEFAVNNVAPGYTVATFERDGYTSADLGFMVEEDRDVALAEVTLFPVGRITGVLVGPHGKAASGAIVFVCQTIPRGNHTSKTQTDKRGRFQVSAPPGFHKVFAYVPRASLVGEGMEGGLGSTVSVRPGGTTSTKLTLRRYNIEPRRVLRSYGPEC